MKNHSSIIILLNKFFHEKDKLFYYFFLNDKKMHFLILLLSLQHFDKILHHMNTLRKRKSSIIDLSDVCYL